MGSKQRFRNAGKRHGLISKEQRILFHAAGGVLKSGVYGDNNLQYGIRHQGVCSRRGDLPISREFVGKSGKRRGYRIVIGHCDGRSVRSVILVRGVQQQRYGQRSKVSKPIYKSLTVTDRVAINHKVTRAISFT